MKNLYKIAAFTFAMFGFTVAANAQSTATSEPVTASATVVTPININHTGVLNFGDVIATPGVVTISPEAARSTTQSNVDASVNVIGIEAPVFTVTGQKGYSYVVSFSPNVELTNTTDAQTMTINNFTTTAGTGLLDATTGEQQFSVGADLTVSGTQTEGIYTGTYEVTVNYN